MAMPNRPRIVYDVTTINLSLPMATWSPRRRYIGGSKIVDSGATASYVRRKDSLLFTPLRATETEFYTLILPWIDWTHENGMGPYTFRADQDVASDLLMYMESPAFGEDFEPSRDEGDPSVFIVPILHRRTTDAVINLPVYP